MKTKLLIATLLTILCGWAAGRSASTHALTASQEQENALREAKPDEVPFAYDTNVFSKVEIESVPKRLVEADSFPEEAPAHSCYHLRDTRTFPALEKGPRYFQPAYNVICIIPLTDSSVTNFAKAYPNLNEAAAKLRKLLATRPVRFRFDKDLTDIPFNDATGAIESKVQYLSFKTGRGIFFLTQYTQDLQANPVNNEELTSDFQGLSNDGKYYVAARLAVTHPSLPKGIDFTDRVKRDKNLLYLKKQEQALNRYRDESFQPSLRTLKSLLASITTK